jgi:tetrahydromethanopterin S-methyltransferase subunit A
LPWSTLVRQDERATGSVSKKAAGEAIARLGEAAAAKKCWTCGCLHDSLRAIEERFPPGSRPPGLDAAIRAARDRLLPVRYDCLGREVCFPPLAMNALGVEAEACPAGTIEARAGWPSLPGSYTVLRYQAPVAIGTLTDESLAAAVAAAASSEIAIAGTCQTENLGIERPIRNTLANPNIRFLIVCGTDSRQAVGHLPGQSLVALSHSGLDERARIICAHGKRPFLRNLGRDFVGLFRRTVEVVDLVGQSDVPAVFAAATACANRNPGPSESIAGAQAVRPVRGHLPERMVSDPSGWFVVYVDRRRRTLSLEHYRKEGVLDSVIEGATAAELYVPAIERNLVSRLDHAAYLGRELTRAERALALGETYAQDGAPEAPPLPEGVAGSTPDPTSCGCGPACGDAKR